MKGIEIRTFNAELKAEGDSPKIRGVASVFNQLSEDLGGFRETIDPASFGSLINTCDVFALINHDANLVLGRNKSGTLRLSEDNTGLNFEVDPPNTTYANDLLAVMARGDMDKCSFAFRVADEYWEKVDGEDIRHITKFASLHDVSVVTYPAFPQTSAQLNGKDILTPEQVYTEFRSLEAERKQEPVVVPFIKRNKLEIYEKLKGH